MKTGSRSRICVLTFALTLLGISSNGCRTKNVSSKGEGIALSSALPFQSYLQFATAQAGAAPAHIYFPLLQVYDADGRLVYTGHDGEKNASVMNHAPGNITTFNPIPNAMPLAEVLKRMPEIAGKSDALLKAKQPTVFSVVLEDCHACSVQEHALDSSQDDAIRRGVNFVTVKVTKTGTSFQ